MEKFIIGGKEYDASVTYRVRRFFTDNSTKEKVEKLSFNDQENMVLDAILMCLTDKALFNVITDDTVTTERRKEMRRELLMDSLTNDEFMGFDKRFGELLGPVPDGGKTDIEKKPEETTGS